MMDSLPSELLFCILENFSCDLLRLPPPEAILFPDGTPRHDLFNLCLTSRSIRARAQPLLDAWRPLLTVTIPDERKLEDRDLSTVPDHVVKAASRRARDDDGVRAVVIEAKGYDRLNFQSHCFHNLDAALSPSHLPLDPPCRKLSASLLAVLEPIQENQLTSFVWRLGTCTPPQILGKDGWLARSQSRSIQSLSLYTDGCCSWNASSGGHCNPDLAPFRNLRSFSWINCQTTAEIEQAAIAIRQNAVRLQSLDISILGPSGDGPPPPYNSDSDHLAAIFLQSDNPPAVPPVQVYLPCLTTLSLVGFNMTGYEALMGSVNWAGLSTLTVRGCKWLPYFLQALSQPGIQLNLEVCEIRLEQFDVDARDEFSIIEFLKSFSGRLRDLSIDFEPWISRLEHQSTSLSLWPRDPSSIWDALSGHRSTLRRFSYERLRWVERSLQLPDPGYSQLGLKSPEATGTVESKEGGVTVASLNHLESLSLAFEPHLVKAIVLPAYNNSPGIKLLQIRRGNWAPGIRYIPPVCFGRVMHSSREEEELRDLLDSLFGANGMKSLQVLAYGDVFQDTRELSYPLFFTRSQRGPSSPLEPSGDNDDSKARSSQSWEVYRPKALGGDSPDDRGLNRIIQDNMGFLRSAFHDRPKDMPSWEVNDQAW